MLLIRIRGWIVAIVVMMPLSFVCLEKEDEFKALEVVLSVPLDIWT